MFHRYRVWRYITRRYQIWSVPENNTVHSRLSDSDTLTDVWRPCECEPESGDMLVKIINVCKHIWCEIQLTHPYVCTWEWVPVWIACLKQQWPRFNLPPTSITYVLAVLVWVSVRENAKLFQLIPLRKSFFFSPSFINMKYNMVLNDGLSFAFFSLLQSGNASQIQASHSYNVFILANVRD